MTAPGRRPIAATEEGAVPSLQRIGAARLPTNPVKICGLREPAHARAAVRAGADLLGFVFAPARRQVTAAVVRACVEAARDEAGSRPILAVGVFVDASPAEMNAIVAEADLDLLQLHGEEAPETLASLDRPAIRALRLPPGTPLAEAEERIARSLDAAVAPIAFLLDGFSARTAGGEGVRADWSVAAALARRYPLLLAGGLDPGNVAAAVATARPLGVDVSSGVESDGVKDGAKIAAFVAAAKRALAARHHGDRSPGAEGPS
jgi:phosphoribosylanthranilate isomerase